MHFNAIHIYRSVTLFIDTNCCRAHKLIENNICLETIESNEKKKTKTLYTILTKRRPKHS